MEWNSMPSTAASLPNPAAMEKISTQRTVGTARMKATTIRTVFEIQAFDKFDAAISARKKAIPAPRIVDKNAKPNVTPTW